MLVLAIDVGTTAVKAALLDEAIVVRAIASATQRVHADAVGRHEHDPRETWRAVVRAARGAIAAASREEVPNGHPNVTDAVCAVVVTGPRGTFGVTGPGGVLRTAFLTWQDRRAAGVVLSHVAAESYRAIAGTAFEPSAVLPKVVWLRDRTPQIFAGQWQLVTPQGWVLRTLGADEEVVDHSVAAHTGLLDVRQLAWSPALMGRFDVPMSAMPRLIAPGTSIGTLARRSAQILGLQPGIPLVAAASDGVCAELGAGVVEPGQLYAYLGTAATIAGPVLVSEIPVDPSLILMPGSSPERWRILGLAMAGGSARDWYRRSHGVRSHAAVERLVMESPPGARGVLFLPALAGASAPVPNPRARGLYVGLSLATTQADLARALHEGVALELRWLMAAIRTGTPPPTELRLTGGGSRSDAWAAIVADVTGVPVSRVREPNPGLRGAAAYGLSAAGLHGSALEAMRTHQPSCDSFTPRIAYRAIYDDASNMYRLLRQVFDRGAVDDALYRRMATLPLGDHG
jgi:xylulokinase